MAEPSESNVTDALVGEEKSSPAGAGRMWMILALVVVAAAAGGGILLSRMMSKDAVAASEPPDAPAPAEAEDCIYYDMEPVTVNLKDPRMTRHVRATLTLALAREDAGEAQRRIDEKMPELKNWLIVYLNDCTLDDVSGARSLNRIRRDVEDAYNEILWPDSRPLISRVTYKEWAVQ